MILRAGNTPRNGTKKIIVNIPDSGVLVFILHHRPSICASNISFLKENRNTRRLETFYSCNVHELCFTKGGPTQACVYCVVKGTAIRLLKSDLRKL